MVLCEELECSVCLLPYTRKDRIPRLLHCRHTFCSLCLQTMSQCRGSLLTVGCPLCRRVTCVGRGLSLDEALWVNSKLWDQIPDDLPEEEEQGGQQDSTEEGRLKDQQESSLQAQCASIRSRTKLKLPALFKRLSLTKHPQERIIPGSNVQMKSWRRLSAEDSSPRVHLQEKVPGCDSRRS